MQPKNEGSLGELLTRSGVISERQLKEALKEQGRTGARLGKAIVSLGYVTDEEVTEALSRQLGAPYVDLEGANPPPELLGKIPESLARRHLFFPLERKNGMVRIAMADPLDLSAVDELAAKLSCGVEVVISTERRIMRAIDQCYGMLGPEDGTRISRVSDKVEVYGADAADNSAGEKAPISKLVESVIRRGVSGRASDIHIEPREENLSVRYRVDGTMFTAPSPPKSLTGAIVSRVKIMAGLDIAESRIPQDGGFWLSLNGERLEFRVSTFPTIYGESVVIRILNRSDMLMGLEDTGLRGGALARFKDSLARKWGMVIVTGPTGSGKTTTLYAALCEISSSEKTIITIEDPVEYRLENVRQTQVNQKAGLTFATGLRSMLRQDPDVIMVGEIRDAETARIAVQAAATGHLVLTTTHTTDSASAVTRLMDLGIEPYQIASTLSGVLAQRLVRRVCGGCGGDGKRGGPRGCSNCRDSGYKGRVGIFEFLAADEDLKGLITSRAPLSTMRDMARERQGMETMREDGLTKAKEGVTTFDEVDKAVGEG